MSGYCFDGDTTEFRQSRVKLVCDDNTCVLRYTCKEEMRVEACHLCHDIQSASTQHR